MLKKKCLLAPGPTQVPTEALLAMARPIIHHRTAEYREIFKKVTEGLKQVFKTTGDVLTFSGSGTGAMEASIINTLSTDLVHSSEWIVIPAHHHPSSALLHYPSNFSILVLFPDSALPFQG